MFKQTLAVICTGLAFAGVIQAQDLTNLLVSAKMDIYRAGGYDDGSDGVAPVVLSFRAKAGRTLSFASVSGEWSGGGALTGPDGTIPNACCSFSIPNPTGPFSGYNSTDFEGAMVGMFLEDTLPVTAPPPLRFYTQDASLGGNTGRFPDD